MELNYLETYIDVYELAVGPGLIPAGDRLMTDSSLTLHNFSRNGYVLEIFQELLLGRIDLEAFMQIGDETDEREIHLPHLLFEVPAYLETMQRLDDTYFENGLILVDRALQHCGDGVLKGENLYFI